MLTVPVRRSEILIKFVLRSGQRRLSQAARLAARSGARTENVSIEETSKVVTEKKIYVLHDLDNKQPRHLPAEQLVHNIRQALEPKFGAIQSFKAYGNRHTFEWVFPYEKRQRALKASGAPMVGDNGLPLQQACTVCGRKFATVRKLETHFKQLHEREFKKRLAHKPAAKAFFRDEARRERYFTARDSLLTPKKGVWLQQRLTRQDVHVTKVENTAQAADVAMHAEIRSLLEDLHQDGDPALHCLCLISDDRGFDTGLRACKQQGLGTIAICERPDAFSNADIILSWLSVCKEPEERTKAMPED